MCVVVCLSLFLIAKSINPECIAILFFKKKNSTEIASYLFSWRNVLLRVAVPRHHLCLTNHLALNHQVPFFVHDVSIIFSCVALLSVFSVWLVISRQFPNKLSSTVYLKILRNSDLMLASKQASSSCL